MPHHSTQHLGRLLDSTQKIVQSFLGSPLPLVVYVAATSAGCFITMAVSVAAMAPATTIGAAHPVSLGGNPIGGEEKPDETMKKKRENFSVSYIETIAARRQRNVEWAKSAVRDSASITATKALELKVIDLIAPDLPNLLKQLNGRQVDGKTFNTAGAEVTEIKMSSSEQVFQKLWRPEVMFVLMLIAIYGIIGELTMSGAILPGMVGAIALILALYMAASRRSNRVRSNARRPRREYPHLSRVLSGNDSSQNPKLRARHALQLSINTTEPAAIRSRKSDTTGGFIPSR